MVKRNARIGPSSKRSGITSIGTDQIGQNLSQPSNSPLTPPSPHPPEKLLSKSCTDISLASSHLSSTTTPHPPPWTLSKPECSTTSKLTTRLLRRRPCSRRTHTVI